MARPPKNPDAPGIYPRGNGWYWLRYTVNSKEVRVPLRTKRYEQAVVNAIKKRGQVLEGNKKANSNWHESIEKYLREKQSPKKPGGYSGRSWRIFRPGTVVRVRSCLNVFARWSNVAKPSAITVKKLEDYLEHASKKSNAGGRSKLSTIQAFLRHIGCSPGDITLPSSNSIERREIVVSISVSNKMIEAAPTDQLRFILFCGFHAGLRRSEIMHARKSWFHIDRGILEVPRVDFCGGKKFEAKDRETRSIPISVDFLVFLRTFLRGLDNDEYCLRNPTKRRSRNRTYDFRQPFEKFMRKFGRPDVFPHAMRHSWITELCNSSNHSIQDVSAWSGDTIQTIERSYWHKKAVAGALDETMRGKKNADAIKEVLQILKQNSTTAMDKELAGAIQNVLKIAEKTQNNLGNWTARVPETHARLYSVQDTVSNPVAFQSLVGPEPEQKISEKDLTEGRLSTPRARLFLLKEMGYVKF